MGSVSRLSTVLMTAVIVSTARSANGQIINQYFPQGLPGYDTGLGVTVQSRARDEYIVPGVRFGDVVVKPSFNEAVGYNSNVSGSPQAHGSLQISTNAAIQASTDWSRDGLFTYLGFGELTFPEMPNQNQTNWVAALGGTHDFGRDQLRIAYSHFSLQQTAADLGSLNYQTPLTFHADDVRTSYKSDFGRISITPGIEGTNYTFDQASIGGSPTSQQYRDRTFVLGSLTLGYAFAPQRNALLVFNGYETQYTYRQADQPSRNNSGFSVLAGLEYTANGVFRYRGLIGFEQRSYASGTYAGQGVPIGEGEVIWTPTGLTTLTASVSRAIEDAASETAAGFTYTGARLVIDHEFEKNILLEGYAGLQSAVYQQGGGSQAITNAGVNVTWLLNRNIHLVASYDYTTSNASTGGSNFAGNTYGRNIYLLQVSLVL